LVGGRIWLGSKTKPPADSFNIFGMIYLSTIVVETIIQFGDEDGGPLGGLKRPKATKTHPKGLYSWLFSGWRLSESRRRNLAGKDGVERWRRFEPEQRSAILRRRIFSRRLWNSFPNGWGFRQPPFFI